MPDMLDSIIAEELGTSGARVHRMDELPSGWNTQREQQFQTWYAPLAHENGLDPNPDDPEHHYNYRMAFDAGAAPGADRHWPSQFKDATHPNRYVGGEDTITGQRQDGVDLDSIIGEELNRTVDPMFAESITPEMRAQADAADQQSRAEAETLAGANEFALTSSQGGTATMARPNLPSTPFDQAVLGAQQGAAQALDMRGMPVIGPYLARQAEIARTEQPASGVGGFIGKTAGGFAGLLNPGKLPENVLAIATGGAAAGGVPFAAKGLEAASSGLLSRGFAPVVEKVTALIGERFGPEAASQIGDALTRGVANAAPGGIMAGTQQAQQETWEDPVASLQRVLAAAAEGAGVGAIGGEVAHRVTPGMPSAPEGQAERPQTLRERAIARQALGQMTPEAAAEAGNAVASDVPRETFAPIESVSPASGQAAPEVMQELPGSGNQQVGQEQLAKPNGDSGLGGNQDISSLSYPELRAEAKRRGLSATGTKAALLERLGGQAREPVAEVPSTSLPEAMPPTPRIAEGGETSSGGLGASGNLTQQPRPMTFPEFQEALARGDVTPVTITTGKETVRVGRKTTVKDNTRTLSAAETYQRLKDSGEVPTTTAPPVGAGTPAEKLAALAKQPRQLSGISQRRLSDVPPGIRQHHGELMKRWASGEVSTDDAVDAMLKPFRASAAQKAEVQAGDESGRFMVHEGSGERRTAKIDELDHRSDVSNTSHVEALYRAEDEIYDMLDGIDEDHPLESKAVSASEKKIVRPLSPNAEMLLSSMVESNRGNPNGGVTNRTSPEITELINAGLLRRSAPAAEEGWGSGSLFFTKDTVKRNAELMAERPAVGTRGTVDGMPGKIVASSTSEYDSRPLFKPDGKRPDGSYGPAFVHRSEFKPTSNNETPSEKLARLAKEPRQPIVDRISEAQQRARDRIAQRTIPRGRNTGAAIDPIGELIDHAIIIAGDAAKAGISAGKALSDFVGEAAKAARLDKDEDRIGSIVRGILRDATDAAGKIDPDRYAAAANAATNPAQTSFGVSPPTYPTPTPAQASPPPTTGPVTTPAQRLAQIAQQPRQPIPTSAQHRPSSPASQQMGFTPPIMRAVGRIFSPNTPTRLSEAAAAVTGRLKGHSLPRLVAANAEAGEAGISLASANVAAKGIANELLANSFNGIQKPTVPHVWQPRRRTTTKLTVKPDSDFSRKLGAVIVEDQLRTQRRIFTDAGDLKAAAAVKTIVGPRGTLKSDAEYLRAIKDPQIRKALNAVKNEIMPVVTDLYQRAGGKTLHDVGDDTGVFLSLKPVKPGDQIASGSSAFARGRAEPVERQPGTAFRRRTSPNARQRTGSSDKYDIDFVRQVENSVMNQLSIAKTREFQEALVKSGDAVITTPDKAPDQIKGEPVRSREVWSANLIMPDPNGGKASVVPVRQKIYYRESLAKEIEAAHGDSIHGKKNLLQKAGNELAAVQIIVGLSDNVSHTARTFSQLMVNPEVGRGTIMRAAGKLGGLPRFMGAADAVMSKAIKVANRDPAVAQQIRELAEIGAMRDFSVAGDTRPPDSIAGRVIDTLTGGYWEKVTGAPIKTIDVAGRLALDDAWHVLRDKGLTPDTPQSRREFVNQMGQYNIRLQGATTRFLRQYVSPFITGGATGIRGGIRSATAAPRAMPTSLLASARLRTQAAGVVAGTVAQIVLANFLIWGKGRPDGVPLGAIKTGEDKDGRPRFVDALDITTGARRGLRALGLREPLDAAVDKRSVDQDRAYTDIINTLSRPLLGPGVNAAAVAATGSELSMERLGHLRQVAEVAPPGPGHAVQTLKNQGKAALTYLGGQVVPKPGGENTDAEKIVQQNIGPFAPRSGLAASEIEDRQKRAQTAQMYEYIDDLVKRSKRNLNADERIPWIRAQIMANVEMGRDRGRALQEVGKRRKSILRK